MSRICARILYLGPRESANVVYERSNGALTENETGALRLYERVGFRPLVQMMHAPLTG